MDRPVRRSAGACKEQQQGPASHTFAWRQQTARSSIICCDTHVCRLAARSGRPPELLRSYRKDVDMETADLAKSTTGVAFDSKRRAQTEQCPWRERSTPAAAQSDSSLGVLLVADSGSCATSEDRGHRSHGEFPTTTCRQAGPTSGCGPRQEREGQQPAEPVVRPLFVIEPQPRVGHG